MCTDPKTSPISLLSVPPNGPSDDGFGTLRQSPSVERYFFVGGVRGTLQWGYRHRPLLETRAPRRTLPVTRGVDPTRTSETEDNAYHRPTGSKPLVKGGFNDTGVPRPLSPSTETRTCLERGTRPLGPIARSSPGPWWSPTARRERSDGLRR